MIEKGVQYKARLLKSPINADKKTAPEAERLQGLLIRVVRLERTVSTSQTYV